MPKCLYTSPALDSLVCEAVAKHLLEASLVVVVAVSCRIVLTTDIYQHVQVFPHLWVSTAHTRRRGAWLWQCACNT